MAIAGGAVPAFWLTPVERKTFRIMASSNVSASKLPDSIGKAEQELLSAAYHEATAWIRADHAPPLRKLGYIIMPG